MRCLHCRVRLSFLDWCTYSSGSPWGEHEITCRRCGARMRPPSRAARLGLSAGSIGLGMLGGHAAVGLLPVAANLATVVFVVVATAAGVATNYAMSRYRLSAGGPRSELPPSRALVGHGPASGTARRVRS